MKVHFLALLSGLAILRATSTCALPPIVICVVTVDICIVLVPLIRLYSRKLCFVLLVLLSVLNAATAPASQQVKQYEQDGQPSGADLDKVHNHLVKGFLIAFVDRLFHVVCIDAAFKLGQTVLEEGHLFICREQNHYEFV